MWVYGKGLQGVIFCVGRCVVRVWVVGGGGLDGYFGEQGLPAGIQDVLEDFTEDALTISAGSLFQNCEGDLATARTASLLVAHVGVAA